MFNKVILFFIFSSLLFTSYGQEKNNLSFRAIDFSIGVPYLDNNIGLNANIGLSASYKENIIKAFAGGGAEFTVSLGDGDNNPDSYEEYNIMYGREITINDKMILEVYGGTGYFISNKNNEKSKNIGFPLQVQIVFPTKRKVNYGVQLHSNINSFMTIFSTGFLVNYKF